MFTNVGAFRSSDSGFTWSQILLKYPIAYNVEFKNDSVGWIIADSAIGFSKAIFQAEVLRTTDAGSTWIPLTTLYAPIHISSQKQTSKKLFHVSWISNFTGISTDDGDNWITSPTSGNGITFVDSEHLVVGDLGSPSTSISSDDGNTWTSATTFAYETWQPLAIPGTDTVIFASEDPQAIYFN